MIPIRDVNPPNSTPVVTYTLVVINIVVFAYQWLLGPNSDAFILAHGVVPWLFATGDPRSWPTILTSMFMHGGFMHILGNMWFLHIFGDNVEDALGRTRYIVFYCMCGFLAAGAQIAITLLMAESGPPITRADPRLIPMIGASGAIAGVIGAYVRLYPRARVLTLLPLIVIVQFTELPAFAFAFVWLGLQVLQGLLSLTKFSGGGVAFFAHIGGLLAGYFLVQLILPPWHQTESNKRRTERLERWER